MIGNFRHNLHIISIKIDMAVTPVVFDVPSFKFTEDPPGAGSLGSAPQWWEKQRLRRK